MWWAGTEARLIEVFLTRHGWSACRGGVLGHAESDLAEADVLPSVVEWLVREGGGRWWAPVRVAVYLSGALCRPFLLPELPAMSKQEQLLAINAAAKKRTGFSEELQIWLSPMLDDGTPGSGAHQLGGAMPANLWREVPKSIERSRGIRLVSLQPIWSLALRAAWSGDETNEPAPDMLLVRDADAVTILASAVNSSLATSPATNGFAAAHTVEAAPVDGHQRSAILRLVSGLDNEPQRPHEFVVASASPTKSDGGEDASNLVGGTVLPLAALWTLERFDLETV